MGHRFRARLACGALLLLFARPAGGGTLTLDLDTALRRARARAPEAIAALGRVDEARAARAGAAVWSTDNPELQLGGGTHDGDTRHLALRAQLAVPLDLGRRGPRRRAADAAVARAEAVRDAELRELDTGVANAFHDARFADLAVELARRAHDLAQRGADAAARRRRAGDATDLDVQLAAIALGRARAAVTAALAERATAVGRLAALVGAGTGDELALSGELRPAPLALDTLRAAIPARPDLRALEAEARAARADGAAARAAAWPALGLWAAYERDDATLVAGGITATLPLWNRAQGDRAAARARLRRSELERAAATTAAARRLADAFEAYTRSREALEIFERDVLPALADSEHLLERSLETGQLAVGGYLAVRQEVLAGRREHLERQLQLARAATAARAAAGVAP